MSVMSTLHLPLELWGGIECTIITDVEQETNGLLTTKRWSKLDPAVVREITKRPSASIPGDVIAQMMKVQDVTAFANASSEASLATEVQQQ